MSNTDFCADGASARGGPDHIAGTIEIARSDDGPAGSGQDANETVDGDEQDLEGFSSKKTDDGSAGCVGEANTDVGDGYLTAPGVKDDGASMSHPGLSSFEESGPAESSTPIAALLEENDEEVKRNGFPIAYEGQEQLTRTDDADAKVEEEKTAEEDADGHTQATEEFVKDDDYQDSKESLEEEDLENMWDNSPIDPGHSLAISPIDSEIQDSDTLALVPKDLEQDLEYDHADTDRAVQKLPEPGKNMPRSPGAQGDEHVAALDQRNQCTGPEDGQEAAFSSEAVNHADKDAQGDCHGIHSQRMTEDASVSQPLVTVLAQQITAATQSFTCLSPGSPQPPTSANLMDSNLPPTPESAPQQNKVPLGDMMNQSREYPVDHHIEPDTASPTPQKDIDTKSEVAESYQNDISEESDIKQANGTSMSEPILSYGTPGVWSTAAEETETEPEPEEPVHSHESRPDEKTATVEDNPDEAPLTPEWTLPEIKDDQQSAADLDAWRRRASSVGYERHGLPPLISPDLLVEDMPLAQGAQSPVDRAADVSAPVWSPSKNPKQVTSNPEPVVSRKRKTSPISDVDSERPRKVVIKKMERSGYNVQDREVSPTRARTPPRPLKRRRESRLRLEHTLQDSESPVPKRCKEIVQVNQYDSDSDTASVTGSPIVRRIKSAPWRVRIQQERDAELKRKRWERKYLQDKAARDHSTILATPAPGSFISPGQSTSHHVLQKDALWAKAKKQVDAMFAKEPPLHFDNYFIPHLWPKRKVVSQPICPHAAMYAQRTIYFTKQRDSWCQSCDGAGLDMLMVYKGQVVRPGQVLRTSSRQSGVIIAPGKKGVLCADCKGKGVYKEVARKVEEKETTGWQVWVLNGGGETGSVCGCKAWNRWDDDRKMREVTCRALAKEASSQAWSYEQVRVGWKRAWREMMHLLDAWRVKESRGRC